MTRDHAEVCKYVLTPETIWMSMVCAPLTVKVKGAIFAVGCMTADSQSRLRNVEGFSDKPQPTLTTKNSNNLDRKP